MKIKQAALSPSLCSENLKISQPPPSSSSKAINYTRQNHSKFIYKPSFNRFSQDTISKEDIIKIQHNRLIRNLDGKSSSNLLPSSRDLTAVESIAAVHPTISKHPPKSVEVHQLATKVFNRYAAFHRQSFNQVVDSSFSTSKSSLRWSKKLCVISTDNREITSGFKENGLLGSYQRLIEPIPYHQGFKSLSFRRFFKEKPNSNWKNYDQLGYVQNNDTFYCSASQSRYGNKKIRQADTFLPERNFTSDASQRFDLIKSSRKSNTLNATHRFELSNKGRKLDFVSAGDDYSNNQRQVTQQTVSTGMLLETGKSHENIDEDVQHSNGNEITKLCDNTSRGFFRRATMKKGINHMDDHIILFAKPGEFILVKGSRLTLSHNTETRLIPFKHHSSNKTMNIDSRLVQTLSKHLDKPSCVLVDNEVDFKASTDKVEKVRLGEAISGEKSGGILEVNRAPVGNICLEDRCFDKCIKESKLDFNSDFFNKRTLSRKSSARTRANFENDPYGFNSENIGSSPKRRKIMELDQTFEFNNFVNKEEGLNNSVGRLDNIGTHMNFDLKTPLDFTTYQSEEFPSLRGWKPNAVNQDSEALEKCYKSGGVKRKCEDPDLFQDSPTKRIISTGNFRHTSSIAKFSENLDLPDNSENSKDSPSKRIIFTKDFRHTNLFTNFQKISTYQISFLNFILIIVLIALPILILILVLIVWF